MGGTQISVSGLLTVPEHKPDIESILRISTTAIIDKTITMRKKIFFAGHVDICIEYRACNWDSTHPLHCLHTEIPFKGLRLHHCARERYESFLKAKIRFCESDIITPRTINSIVILKLCKLKFRHIPKTPDSQACKPFQDSLCKPLNPHCAPPEKFCYEQPHCCSDKPPSDDHDCKVQHNDECKPPPHTPDDKHHDCGCNIPKPPAPPNCHPQHSKECKPPSPPPDCAPHYSGYCKPPTYDDYAYKSQPHGNCKAHEYISSDDFHLPTYIQPCKRMGNSHGVSFGVNYQE
jgi:hypothetical protein